MNTHIPEEVKIIEQKIDEIDTSIKNAIKEKNNLYKKRLEILTDLREGMIIKHRRTCRKYKIVFVPNYSPSSKKGLKRWGAVRISPVTGKLYSAFEYPRNMKDYDIMR